MSLSIFCRLSKQTIFRLSYLTPTLPQVDSAGHRKGSLGTQHKWSHHLPFQGPCGMDHDVGWFMSQMVHTLLQCWDGANAFGATSIQHGRLLVLHLHEKTEPKKFQAKSLWSMESIHYMRGVPWAKYKVWHNSGAQKLVWHVLSALSLMLFDILLISLLYQL